MSRVAAVTARDNISSRGGSRRSVADRALRSGSVTCYPCKGAAARDTGARSWADGKRDGTSRNGPTGTGDIVDNSVTRSSRAYGN